MTDKQGMTCPITGCPVKNILLSAIAVFIVRFAFDWVFHGVYLMPVYEATASLWRPEEEMQGLFHICLIRQGVIALSIAALYGLATNRFSQCGCLKTSVVFGAFVGLMLGITAFGTYAWSPIPMSLALNWLGGEIILGVLVGLALGLVNKKCGGSCATK